MLLRITGQHKTRNVVKRTVHWNRMEPNRLRTEPTRTVLRFLSDFANLHEPKRTAGSLVVYISTYFDTPWLICAKHSVKKSHLGKVHSFQWQAHPTIGVHRILTSLGLCNQRILIGVLRWQGVVADFNFWNKVYILNNSKYFPYAVQSTSLLYLWLICMEYEVAAVYNNLCPSMQNTWNAAIPVQICATWSQKMASLQTLSLELVCNNPTCLIPFCPLLQVMSQLWCPDSATDNKK